MPAFFCHRSLRGWFDEPGQHTASRYVAEISVGRLRSRQHLTDPARQHVAACVEAMRRHPAQHGLLLGPRSLRAAVMAVPLS